MEWKDTFQTCLTYVYNKQGVGAWGHVSEWETAMALPEGESLTKATNSSVMVCYFHFHCEVAVAFIEIPKRENLVREF